MTADDPSFEVRNIRFIGEQDGPIERNLKAKLCTILSQEESVLRAYLVRAVYDVESGVNVTLCIRCDGDPPGGLVGKVAAIFGSMFGSHEHLDTLFLTDEREQEVRSVCSPFYPV